MSGHETSPPGFRTHRLGQKSLDVLRLCALPSDAQFNRGPRARRYRKLVEAYSEKAVIAKLYKLSEKDLIDWGVSPVYAWLTEKGRAVLAAEDERQHLSLRAFVDGGAYVDADGITRAGVPPWA